jgi:hypothetical protein
MICAHCGTLLVEDRFMDWTARWRCLKCGRVQDSLSVENHLARQREHVLREDVRPDYLNEEAPVGSEAIVRHDVPEQCLPRRDRRKSHQPKRNLKRLVLLTLLTLSSAPAYGEWVEVSVNVEAGETVYVDPDTIRRRGDIAEMSVLYDNKTAQPAVGHAYLSKKVQNEYNCKEAMKRMLSVTEFSGHMGSGNVVYMSSPLFSPATWMPTRIGLGETLSKVACGKGPTSAPAHTKNALPAR